MAIIIVCGILIFILFYNKTVDGKKFLKDNEKYFELLREEDFDFLVYAKYGDELLDAVYNLEFEFTEEELKCNKARVELISY